MGQDLLSSLNLETKRLLWLIGITFGFILAFQYFELPYGNVLVNLFHTSKIPVSGGSSFGTAKPPSKSEISDNMTTLNKPNSTGGGDSFEKTAPKNGLVLKPEKNESHKVSVVDSVKKPDNVSETKHEEGLGHNIHNISMGSNYLTNGSGEEDTTSRSQHETASSYANVSNVSSVWKENVTTSKKDGTLRPLQNDVNVQGKNSPMNSVAKESKDSHVSIPEVTQISEMNKLLLQSHTSYRSMV